MSKDRRNGNKGSKSREKGRKTLALKIFAGFFAVMAVCTVLSRAASSVLVARVEVENPVSGNVAKVYEGGGRVVPEEKKQVFLWPQQQVEKSAEVGSTVKKGECLVQFRREYLDETIGKKQSELDGLSLQLKQQQIAAKGSDYVPASDGAARALESAQAQLTAAEQKAQDAQAAYDSFEGEEQERQTLYGELEAALSEKAAAEQAVNEARNALEDAKAQDAVQESNKADAAQTAQLAAQEIQVQIDEAEKELKKLKAYQEADGKICAEEDCVVLENPVADGSITTGAEILTIGSGAWKLKGTASEEARGKLEEGTEIEVTFGTSARAEKVEVDSLGGSMAGSTGGGTDGSAGGDSDGGAGGSSDGGAGGSSDGGAGGSSDGSAGDGSDGVAAGGLDGGTGENGGNGASIEWYAAVPDGTQASYGTTFTWKAKVKSESSYDCKIPLTALREDTEGNYCLIVEEVSSVLGDVKKAKRVPVMVIDKDAEDAAVDAVLEKTDQVITASEKYVEEGDEIRIKE